MNLCFGTPIYIPIGAIVVVDIQWLPFHRPTSITTDQSDDYGTHERFWFLESRRLFVAVGVLWWHWW